MTDDAPTAPPKPLFSLDLGANGGLIAPRTIDELKKWIDHEQAYWAWAHGFNGGTHSNSIDLVLGSLRAVQQRVDEALYLKQRNDPAGATAKVNEVESAMRDVWITRELPHSSAALAKRINALREESPHAALAYLYAVLPNPNNYRFEPHDKRAWHGLICGLLEHYGPVNGKHQLGAQRAAFNDLQKKIEHVIGETTTASGELIRHVAETAESLKDERSQHVQTFEENIRAFNEEHGRLCREHQTEMLAIRKAFTEGMKLRAPVEYWTSRQGKHEEKAKDFFTITFLSFAFLVAGLAWGTWKVAQSSLDPSRPDAWKLAVLGIVAVMGVWASRLLVRMFLSHHHLATDAAERVTMVQTYLALMADEKLPSEDDRKLVLQPLFRPASDGIVKDEGLPHPVLEFFTRSGRPQ